MKPGFLGGKGMEILNGLRNNKANSSLAYFVIFCCSMLGVRMAYTANLDYVFLLWNLFLAVVPLKIAYYFRKTIAGRDFMHPKTMFILFLWLIFFPNAPYIITDLIHLANSSGQVPVWYDALMIFSFALSGVYAGFLSLYIIYKSVKRYLLGYKGLLFPGLVFLLSAYGIYLGRVLRWNSWDLVTRPHLVFLDVFVNLTDPVAWGITLFFSCFLLFAWYIFNSFVEGDINQISGNESDQKFKEF